MQLALSDNRDESYRYETHHTFITANGDEAAWQHLMQGSLEGYRYHLAFESGKV